MYSPPESSKSTVENNRLSVYLKTKLLPVEPLRSSETEKPLSFWKRYARPLTWSGVVLFTLFWAWMLWQLVQYLFFSGKP